MKCIINGKEVNAKVTENLGFQGGYNAKAVEYEGKEYIVVNKSGTWQQRSVADRF
jgi:hypothetical protein